MDTLGDKFAAAQKQVGEAEHKLFQEQNKVRSRPTEVSRLWRSYLLAEKRLLALARSLRE